MTTPTRRHAIRTEIGTDHVTERGRGIAPTTGRGIKGHRETSEGREGMGGVTTPTIGTTPGTGIDPDATRHATGHHTPGQGQGTKCILSELLVSTQQKRSYLS